MNLSYVPSIPPHLPYVHTYEDGEEGIDSEWRIREHQRPSAAYKHMTTVSPPVRALPPILSSQRLDLTRTSFPSPSQFIMTLPGVDYAPDVVRPHYLS